MGYISPVSYFVKPFWIIVVIIFFLVYFVDNNE